MSLADFSFFYLSSPDSDGPPCVGDWKVIAAHSCISSIFAFADILEGYEKLCKDSVIVKRTRFEESLDKARKLLLRKFPKYVQLRHATQHSGQISVEFYKNAHSGALSAGWLTKSKGSRGLMQDNFHNREFQTVRYGENLKFSVTWDSYNSLVEIYSALLEGMPASS